jgi:hypothetical protein
MAWIGGGGEDITCTVFRFDSMLQKERCIAYCVLV